MIVNLNGWPGVGKLTTARELSKLISGKVLDNHTLLNVANAVAPKGSAEFYAVARAVRKVAFDAVVNLSPGVPVILTNVAARGGPSGFLEENWQAVVALAKARNCDLFSVTLICSAAENARRITSPERGPLGKNQDVAMLAELTAKRTLFDDGATFSVVIDNSDLSATETANWIQSWIQGIRPTNRLAPSASANL